MSVGTTFKQSLRGYIYLERRKKKCSPRHHEFVTTCIFIKFLTFLRSFLLILINVFQHKVFFFLVVHRKFCLCWTVLQTPYLENGYFKGFSNAIYPISSIFLIRIYNYILLRPTNKLVCMCTAVRWRWSGSCYTEWHNFPVSSLSKTKVIKLAAITSKATISMDTMHNSLFEKNSLSTF